jgi:hypothetical protein
MEQLPFGLNPYENDPGAWGASLINNAEILLGVLDAAQARSVTEVGAYAGDLTRLLLRWADRSGARITAVDPFPQPELEQLAHEHSELELVRATSLETLGELPLADAIVLDGDHNYYTVTEELRLISERAAASGGALPMLLLHDVCWPHGRRDDYYDPGQIPPEHRQPIASESGLYPGVPGTRPGGLPYHWPAAQEGGPRNGVLTAIEDFVQAREDVQLAVIPAFFGLGIVYPRGAQYTGEVSTQIAAWDTNPLLARLERNRVLHLASSHVQLSMATDAQQQVARMEGLLRAMLESKAFMAAELWVRLRRRERPPFSRRQIRDLLSQAGGR